MTTTTKRRLAALALGLSLGPGAFATPVSAQAAKEPTDGFFDVPPRAAGEESEPWGLPAYMITSALAAGGIFVLCKSARRS